MAKHEHTELNMFISKKLFKIDGIVFNEQTRLVLIEKMQLNRRQQSTDEHKAELKRKYGGELSTCLLDRLLPSVSECGQLNDPATYEDNILRSVDWSLLREPGTLSCHISELFSRLEFFFSNNPLTLVEFLTKAGSFLTNARSNCDTSASLLLAHPRAFHVRVAVPRAPW